jgi:alanyl-tRNA synthetase
MNYKPEYIIADHIRTACFCIADGVLPSGKQRGYILRRLIRRSLSMSLKMGIDITNNNYFVELVEAALKIYNGTYHELEENKEAIIRTIITEAGKYQKAIAVGQKEWQKILKDKEGLSEITLAEFTWDLYQKAGVPFEISQDICEQNKLSFEFRLVEGLMLKHQELSRNSSSGQFKSGLGENTEKTKKLHTLTHILHQVLRSLYGMQIKQMGSAITDQKARFDFSFDGKIESDDITKIESKVQELIDLELEMSKQEMSEQEARDLGAIGLFGEKYGSKVTVYSLEKNGIVYSREFCGGPHVSNTKELGKFKIIKEKSVSAGVRRIEFDTL